MNKLKTFFIQFLDGVIMGFTIGIFIGLFCGFIAFMISISGQV